MKGWLVTCIFMPLQLAMHDHCNGLELTFSLSNV